MVIGTQDWSKFGVAPSLNHHFNLSTDFETADDTPFFEFGQYHDYYCLLLETWRFECVFFGLNEDGRLVAYVPTWYSWMQFWTFPVGLMYGHPVIQYYGTVTPWFKRFIRTNHLVLDDGYDLASNIDLMRLQYEIHDLTWDKDVQQYWINLFEQLWRQACNPDYTPGNSVRLPEPENSLSNLKFDFGGEI